MFLPPSPLIPRSGASRPRLRLLAVSLALCCGAHAPANPRLSNSGPIAPGNKQPVCTIEYSAPARANSSAQTQRAASGAASGSTAPAPLAATRPGDGGRGDLAQPEYAAVLRQVRWWQNPQSPGAPVSIGYCVRLGLQTTSTRWNFPTTLQLLNFNTMTVSAPVSVGPLTAGQPAYAATEICNTSAPPAVQSQLTISVAPLPVQRLAACDIVFNAENRVAAPLSGASKQHPLPGK